MCVLAYHAYPCALHLPVVLRRTFSIVAVVVVACVCPSFNAPAFSCVQLFLLLALSLPFAFAFAFDCAIFV